MRIIKLLICAASIAACNVPDIGTLFGTGGSNMGGGGAAQSPSMMSSASSTNQSQASSNSVSSSSGMICDPNVTCACTNLAELIEVQAGQVANPNTFACGIIDAFKLNPTCCTGPYATIDCGVCNTVNQSCGYDNPEPVAIPNICGGGCVPSSRFGSLCGLEVTVLCLKGDVISAPPQGNCTAYSNPSPDNRYTIWCCTN